MASPIKISKSDARRALIAYHFTALPDLESAFQKLRSVQFDPIAPIGCNHDLVLQARLPSYKVGDWNQAAYQDRLIYDGWDKQASLVPFSGWPLRRIFHKIHRKWFEKKIFEDHKDAVDAILREMTDRGPMMPRDFEFQQRREDWNVSWFGPSVTKQTLRALWHSGQVMTTGRKNGQHIYDLTERVVPEQLLKEPALDERISKQQLALERHRAMGILRPTAPQEVWSGEVLSHDKRELIAELVSLGLIVPVEVEGMRAHATPEFLTVLDQPSPEPRAIFVAPLDPFVWDRKMTAHIFDFNYIWEIYTPEVKRRWGYYVLPIVFENQIVGRAEFWCREGVIEIREWHFEEGEPSTNFWDAVSQAFGQFMRYASAKKVRVGERIDSKYRNLLLASVKG